MNRSEDLEGRTDRLLEPIAGADPAGAWLRYEGTYEAIQVARRQDDASLPQGIWETSLKVADWGEVETLCVDAIEQKSKDLQIAAWLVEAQVVRHGLAGLAAGLGLVAGLVERYWEGLHPRPEAGDLEFRLSPIEWLDDKVAGRLGFVAVTAPQHNLERAVTAVDWKRAEQSDAAGGSHGGDGGAGAGPALAECRASAALTPAGFFRDLAAGIAAARDRAAEVVLALERKVGTEAPTLHRLREALDEIERVVGQAAPAAREEPVAPARAAAGGAAEAGLEPSSGVTEASGAAEPARAPRPSGAPVASRAEAYRMLAAASDYLLRTEPHSPVPYLVRRAIVWGNLPLGSVLGELLGESSDLARVCALLGIPPPGGPDEGGEGE